METRHMSQCWKLSLVALCAACATEKPLYTWGSYQQVIYDSYQRSSSGPANAIGRLEKDIPNFGRSLKGAPPGFHAQLGFLHHQVGNMAEARKNFETEKRLFPVSSKLMDRLLNPGKKVSPESKKGGKS